MEKNLISVSYATFIGIDISKSWIDVAILELGGEKLHAKFDNTPEGFTKMWKWLKEGISCPKSHWLFCMEHTGMYTRQLVHFLLKKQVDTWLQSGLEIKRSLGIQRGKTDKVDAHRIARYASRNYPDRQLITLTKTSLEKLEDLVANRERVIRAKTALQKPVKELERIDPKNARMLERANKKAIQGLEASLKDIEELIEKTLEEDPELKEKFDLATSVKSVGRVLGLKLLIATHGFTRMMDGRKLVAHAGVAPFSNDSGIFKGKNRTSKLADMQLKATLHMAAVSAIRTNPELREFYLKKVGQGKNKMSVINALRNKLIHRVVAVVKRGKPYIEFPRNSLLLS